MKNRIGMLVIGAGLSLGTAAVMLASGSANALECPVDIVGGCDVIPELAQYEVGCVVAHNTDCSDQSCVVAIGSECDGCLVGSGSDCDPEPTPTATPTAVAQLFELLDPATS